MKKNICIHTHTHITESLCCTAKINTFISQILKKYEELNIEIIKITLYLQNCDLARVAP